MIMAIYMQLIDIDSGKPVKPTDADTFFRVKLGFEPSETDWLEQWYNLIGFALAAGKSIEWIRNEICQPDDETLLDICDLIEQYYDVESGIVG